MTRLPLRVRPLLSRLNRVVQSVGNLLSGDAGFWRWLLAMVALFLVLQIAFFTATLAAGSVPNSRVTGALAVDAERGIWDVADFPRDGVGHTTPAVSFAGVSDSYTECIALTLGISADPAQDDGPLYRALASPHLGTCSTAFPSILALERGEQGVQGYTYNRYWNGSTVITRPLLAVAGVGGVRLVCAVLLVASLIFAFFMFARRSSVWIGATLLLPVLASTNILTQTLDSYPHVLAFSVSMLGLGMGLVVGRKSYGTIVAVALIAGSTLNFVDFLLNPPLAWSAFVFGVAAARAATGTRTLGATALGGITAAMGWVVGYGATWLARWVLAVAVFGDSALREILAVISLRLQGQYEDLVAPGIGQASVRNLRMWWTTIPSSGIVLTAMILVIVVALSVLVVRRDGKGVALVAILSCPALIVPFWYEMLSNHSQIHAWFTYRSVPVALGIIAAAALVPVVTSQRAASLVGAERRKPPSERDVGKASV